MLIAIACLTLLGLGLIVLLVQQSREHQEAQAQWALERRQLCDRIQRPEQPLPAPPRQVALPDPEPDEYDLVGTVRFDPEAYLAGEAS